MQNIRTILYLCKLAVFNNMFSFLSEHEPYVVGSPYLGEQLINNIPNKQNQHGKNIMHNMYLDASYFLQCRLFLVF